MKQQRIKIRKWHALGVGIAVLGMGGWLGLSSTLLKAETEISTPKSEETETRITGRASRALTAVTNERGLAATPKVTIIAQNGAFPIAGTSISELAKLVTNLSIPTPSTGITWEYVGIDGTPITPSTAEIGFQTIYIKITEKTGGSSIQVPIPVNITSGNTTGLLTNQAMIKADSRIILYPDETKDKTNQELQELIQSKANLSAWNMSSGESLPVSATATTARNNIVGSYTVTFTVNLNGTTATTTRDVSVFGAQLKSPYYFLAVQNTTISFGTNAATYFDKYQTVSTLAPGNATYEWVADKNGTPTEPANTIDSSQTGFKWGYIKMTEKTNPAISTVMAVPLTITNENVVIVDGKAAYGTPRGLDALKKSEVSGDTTQKIKDNLKEKLELDSWDVFTGEKLPITITDLGGLTESSGIGKYELTFSITLADNSVKTAKRAYTLLDDSMLGDSLEGWATIPLNDKNGFIENPINNSKLGFISRGMSATGTGGTVQQGFVIKDSANRSYTYTDNKVSMIPFVNGKQVYAGSSTSDNSADIALGLGVRGMSLNLVSEFYLKKDNALRQILVDQRNQLVYVYDFSLSRNLNFKVNLSMFNASSATRQLAMLENVDTDYYTDKVPIYSTGDNSGFYMEPSEGKRFTLKLKDSKGNYLSDYTMQASGIYGNTSLLYPDAPYNLRDQNWFKSDFSRPGIEQYNYEAGHIIVQDRDSAYQLAAPYRPIATNQALKAGYEVFAGSELPYMRLTSDPQEWNIYPDYKGTNFVTDYTLASIPHIGGNGTIYVEYPNEEKTTIPFIADNNLEFRDKLTIPRATLPANLNDESGTVKSYSTSMIGIHETEGPMSGLPSNDYAVTVNVYNIGGTAIAQTVQKGATWSKAAGELIKDPVIVPGNTAVYEYVDGQPDTSKLGLQMIKVRMTDKDEPTQTIIIEVPVVVIDGTAPTTGLTVAANDFSVLKGKLEGLSETEIKELILKESQAIGWDNATGLMAGVTLEVTTTDLTAESNTDKQYKATIKGTKDSLTAQKTITITVASEMTVKAVSQSIPLGSDENYWTDNNLKGVVKEVMNGNKEIESYTVSLVTAPVTNRITTDGSMTVKVSNSANLNQFLEVEIPVSVTWGNAIALGGSGTDVATLGQSSLAMTLQEDQNGRPYIRSTYGNLPQANTNTPFVDAAATAEDFLQLSHIDMSDQATGQTKAKEVTNGTSSDNALKALGAQTPSQVMNNLGTNGKLSVNYGDVLKVFVRQGQHALYTASNGPSQPVKALSNSETLFVVVTKTGFTPLYFNQLTAKEVEIASESTATTALYDAHYNSLANYFSIPSGSGDNYARIKPNGFKTYPKLNLAVDERDTGSISVAEPTNATSNKYLKLAYNVTFVGSGPDLQIVAPLAPLSFGSQTIKSYKQEIKRTDPNWGFTVLDSRQTKSAWVIQAKMSDPFKTSGANAKELKGAELRSKQEGSTVSLNGGFQTIYTKNNPEASNNVTWSSDKGFFLQVPPGVIDKEATYSTEVEFLLTNAP